MSEGRGTGRVHRTAVTRGVSSQEKAYFAGYTDAEGCISICPFRRGTKTYWYAFVSFDQTQPTVVERLQAVYGGNLRERKREQRRRQKGLRIQALDSVRRFLSDVVPYLREKRPQAEIVLRLFDPKAPLAKNKELSVRLVELKAKRLGELALVPRSVITRQVHLKCFDCGTQALSRGYCAKHYQKAKREGRLVANLKGAGVPFTYGRPLLDWEAPYFAGYFDGDGCLAIAGDTARWYPRVTFRQTQPEALIELHAIYGGSLTIERGKDRRRPTLAYQLVQRAGVFALLHDILPFVVEKREQVECFLDRYSAALDFTNGEKLKEELSALKRRTFGETSDIAVGVDS